MRMLYSVVSAAFLATSLVTVSRPGLADPAMAWSSDDLDYEQEVCMQRAQGAFAREGWTGIHPGGNPPLGTVAHKSPLVGLIMCLDRAIGGNHAIAVVVVSGGDDGVADSARDRLQHYMAD